MKQAVVENDQAENYEALMGLCDGDGCGNWLGRLYLALRLDVEGGAGRHGHRLCRWWPDDCRYWFELRLHYSCAAADRWWGGR